MVFSVILALLFSGIKSLETKLPIVFQSNIKNKLILSLHRNPIKHRVQS